jgi:hypothetical protein
MLNHIYTGVQTLLKAKAMANPDNPMAQGMTSRELIDLGDFSPSSLHMALQEKGLAARYGIVSITPNKRRNTLYAFSQSVMDDANAGPFVSPGIDPKLQAEAVNKIVKPCDDPSVHALMEQLDLVRKDYAENLGLIFDDVKHMLNTIIGHDYVTKIQEKSNEQV